MLIDRFVLHHGDCLDVLCEMPENSVDAIVTDPPYGLSFMGKKWDYDVPSEDVWRECLRVLKPGGHLLAFAGTRTQHRMAVRIEDAGFEIRDMIAWVYGSGFPKSLDVSKAIDKAAGAERAVIGMGAAQCEFLARGEPCQGHGDDNGRYGETIHAPITAPATPAARQWDGWGTALKPALEPITLARKPLSGTVAANVLTHGTGALNVDGCRVKVDLADPVHSATYHAKPSVAYGRFASKENGEARSMAPPPAGRWPANFIHDGSDEVVGLFPVTGPGESAARFFYCAKASKRDRDEGCKGMEVKRGTISSMTTRAERQQGKPRAESVGSHNHHPTVKPTDLMRYLCRLVTPPGGVVLDPFTGSGSTGKAAMLEGFHFVGIEREAEYLAIAQARIEHAIERDNAPACNSDDHQKKLFAEIS